MIAMATSFAQSAMGSENRTHTLAIKTLNSATDMPKVVSINLCADQLVLALADEKQILSLSNLSHEQAGSYYYNQAINYPVNSGQAGEVLLLNPDLVIVGAYTDRYTLKALDFMGLRVEVLPIAESIESLLINVTQLAGWLGQNERGDALVASLEERLQGFEVQTAKGPTVAVYDPNGYTVGEQSLRGEVLKRAGWYNLAQDVGISQYGVLPLETLLMLQPDVLMDSPYSAGTFSRAQALNQHPALRGNGLDPVIISVPSSQTICGGPWTIDLIERLIEERKAIEHSERAAQR